MTISVVENKLYIGNKSYAIEKKFAKKLDRVVKGITQKNPKEDAVLINEGKEGKGKTNTAVIEAAYVKAKTGREVRLFFTLDKLIQFAQSTKEKIIIWDEPSLDSLSTDHLNKMNRNMLRLFMTVRKKRHFFIINYTKFWKFPEYMVVDRADGLVHMKNDKIGRFLYIRKKNLERLWNDKRKSNKRSYKQCMSFGGNVPNIIERHFDELGFSVHDVENATYEDYEEQKDLAIGLIGKETKPKKELIAELKLWTLRKKIVMAMKNLKIKQDDLAKELGVHNRRFTEWKNVNLERYQIPT